MAVFWKGRVAGVRFAGGETTISCDPLATALKRIGLRRPAQRQCPHALYDVGCNVAAAAFAASGTLLLALMWIAEWHPARYTSGGEATGSTNPLVDYHVIYALALIVLAVTAAGNRWGLGRAWARLPFVRRHATVLS